MLQYIVPLNISNLRLLFLVETIFIGLNLLLFTYMIAVAFRIQLHVNLKVLAISALSQYYLSLASPLALISLETGLFAPPPPVTHWLPAVLSWCRCYHMTLILSLPLWLYFERSLAMYFIRDYEKTPRRWIVVILLIASTSFSLSGSASFTFGWSNWKLLVLFALITGVVGCFLVYLLKNKTERLYEDLNQCHRTSQLPYSLSIRFQLEENLRSTRLIFQAIVGLGLINVAGFVAFYLSHEEDATIWFGTETVQLLDVLFNLYVTINGVIIAVGMLFRNDYMVKLAKAVLCGAGRPSSSSIDEGQVYFLQLIQQWGSSRGITPL